MQKNTGYLLVLSCCALLYFLWEIKQLPDVLQSVMFAYGVHTILTFVATVLLWTVVQTVMKESCRKQTLAVIALSVLISSSLNEGLQYFVPNRTVELRDFLMQFLGIFLGVALILHINFRQTKE